MSGYRLINGWIDNGQIDRCVSFWISGWMDEHVSEWMNGFNDG